MIEGTPVLGSPSNSGAKIKSNVYILFVEFDHAETDAVISLLRDIKLAPRGRIANSLDETLSAISERSWDLILCKPQTSALDPLQLPQLLTKLERDIPVLQLVEELEPQSQTQAMLKGIQAVISHQQRQILQLSIQRAISQLEQRRKLRSVELQLSQSQKRCQELTDHAAIPIAYIHQQKTLYVNRTFIALFGYQLTDEVTGRNAELMVATQERAGFNQLLDTFSESRDNRQAYQLLCRRADGSQFTAHIELQHHHYQGCNCIQLSVDNSDQILSENKFNQIDPITGLYNFAYFSDALENTLLATHSGGAKSHLIYLELRNYQQTRSELGSEASRTLARDVAQHIERHFNKQHLQARIQDNLFCILYQQSDTDQSMLDAEQLIAQVSDSSGSYQGMPLHSHIAVAVVPLSDTVSSVEEALQHAEYAAQRAAALAPHILPLELYTPTHIDISQEAIELIAKTRAAVDQERFKLLFQPVVPLAFNSTEQHYEVLLRMRDEEDNLLAPAQFLSSVDSADLNERMDRWVIENSIRRFCLELQNNKRPRLFISVTDSVWRNKELLTWLAQLLRDSRVEADHIVFQISENECSGNLAAAKYFVDGLRQLHCLTCLKHYGSSSDSEHILKLLDPDYIKFDASFTQELFGDSLLDSNFSAMLKQLEGRGKITIAPQVETPRVMSLLWKSGICMIQGYYLQAPEDHMDYAFF